MNITYIEEYDTIYKSSVAMQSALDSSFFWGYLLSQAPGGFLAYAYPANKIFGAAVACSAFLNLLLPFAFEIPVMIIGIRLLQGIFGVNPFKAP